MELIASMLRRYVVPAAAHSRVGATGCAAARAAVTVTETVGHDRGMSRTRLSTTVDADLLATARRVRTGASDARLIDEALAALVARHRAAEIDAAYAAYDAQPLDAPDEWGDLAAFRRAAGAS